MFAINEEIKSKQVGEGVTRKILTYSENLMVCELHFDKGVEADLHKHVHEQSSYVVSGSFLVEIDGNTKTLKAGDACIMAPNSPHKVTALEDSVLIDFFTPMRKDFIE